MNEDNLNSQEQIGASSLLAGLKTFFSERNVKAYLVGGFIRDTLLGRITADIDIAVIGDALEISPEIATILGGTSVPMDKINKVARVAFSNSTDIKQLDISTVEKDIENDLARRDFTIDALAFDLTDWGEKPLSSGLIDPFQGSNDLKSKIIRAVSNTSFTDDPVRLLRAIRLAAELSFSIETQTESLMRQSAHLISNVAGERLREEFLRILASSEASRYLRYLDSLGILTAMIPELAQLKGVEQPKEHFWDVFNHSLAAVGAVDFLLRRSSWEYTGEQVLVYVSWSDKIREHFGEETGNGSDRTSMLKLGALLHDISKPETKTIEESGRTRFFGHTDQGAEKAAVILERLRFSRKESELVQTLIRQHLRPVQMSSEGLPSHRAIYRFFRDAGDAAIDVLFLSLADHLAARGPELEIEEWKGHAIQTGYVLTQHFKETSVTEPPKLVDGNDLIQIFALTPGPEIGKILEAVREAQAAGEVSDREQALIYIKNRLIYKEHD